MTEVIGQKEIFPKEDIDVSLDAPVSLFSWLTKAGEIVPPWWSQRRDIALRKIVIGNDNLSGAQYNFVSRLTATPIHVIPKDKSISAHVDQAQIFNQILHFNTRSRSDKTRQGWNFGFGMFLQDLTGVDNGGVLVIEGPGRGDGPLTGMPTGLIHLDSTQVKRTRSYEFPIVYTDYDGKKYKIHYSRVIILSSMPSTIQNMYGVGLCAISRCIHVSQILLDQLVYQEEKLGSRPKERLIIGKMGITGEDIARAFYAADQSLNAQGLTRYSKTVVLAPNSRSSSAEIDLDIQDLVEAGTIFDAQTTTTLGMYTIALAFGVPARWFWPVGAPGGTIGEATMAHLIGMQQGPGEILRSVKEALDLKFLPPHLEISFDYQDDAQDREQAEIKKTRAEQRKIDIEDSVITIRVAREQSLDSGDISQAQFDAMELQDGRLPNGDSLLAAFSNRRDEQLMGMLNLGVAEPLALDENDAFEMIISINDKALEIQALTQNAPSAPLKRKARIALHALGELKKLYEQQATDILAQEIKDEMEIMAQAQEGEVPQEGESPQQEIPVEEPLEEPTEEEVVVEEEPMIEEEEKQFDFGARGGEVIGGGLARDLEGRFISKDELASAIRQKLLDRLRARSGLGKLGTVANRDAVAQELASRMPAGALDGLAVLGEGQPLQGELANRLVDSGLARIDNQGQTRLTSAGASLLIAANNGNVERASDALIRAQTQVGKGRAAGAGRAAAAEKPEKEEEEKTNREDIAGKLKGSSNEMTSDQIESMNKLRLGDPIDNAQELADRGLVEFDEDGVPFLSFDGRVFINAANQGEISLVRDVLIRAQTKLQRKVERIGRLETNIAESKQQVTDLQEQIANLKGATTIREITDRAQLQNRLNQLQDRVDKDTDTLEVLEQRIGGSVDIVEPPPEAEKKSFDEKIDEFLGTKDGLSDYGLSIRAAVRGLWSGAFPSDETFQLFTFLDMMSAAINRGLHRAWIEGAAKVGIAQTDLTDDELNTINDIVIKEIGFVLDFGRDILAANKEKGGKLGPLLTRAARWLNRYNEVVNLGMLSARDNPKLKWVINPAPGVDHCVSAIKLSGKVKRKSQWAAADVRPQDPDKLQCMIDANGIPVCKCKWEETNDPLSKGPLPKLP